jgi:hypothetical protein
MKLLSIRSLFPTLFHEVIGLQWIVKIYVCDVVSECVHTGQAVLFLRYQYVFTILNFSVSGVLKNVLISKELDCVSKYHALEST